MICLYINYPNSHFTIHRNKMCAELGKMHKVNQRKIEVSRGTLGDILAEFVNKKYRFAAKKEVNDLRIDISLDSPEQEIGFVNTIKHILGSQYTRLRNADMKEHC